jgi:hypothetical protein
LLAREEYVMHLYTRRTHADPNFRDSSEAAWVRFDLLGKGHASAAPTPAAKQPAAKQQRRTHAG